MKRRRLMEGQGNEAWRNKRYSFFQHRECESFPCHKTEDAADFNCLFCYCPLYTLGEDCGGSFVYTDTGVKNCVNCIIPHERENYGKILEKYPLLKKLAERKEVK
jgi:Zn-finger protein